MCDETRNQTCSPALSPLPQVDQVAALLRLRLGQLSFLLLELAQLACVARDTFALLGHEFAALSEAVHDTSEVTVEARNAKCVPVVEARVESPERVEWVSCDLTCSDPLAPLHGNHRLLTRGEALWS